MSSSLLDFDSSIKTVEVPYFLTAAIPFSLACSDEYISLVPIIFTQDMV